MISFNKQYLLMFLLSILVGSIIVGIFLSFNNETFANIELDSYKNSTVIEKAPRSILKQNGEPSDKKTVRFEEFDLVKSSLYTPESPWFSAETVNKYDPKYVDVFKTSF